MQLHLYVYPHSIARKFIWNDSKLIAEENTKFPAIILLEDDWDDYGYSTTYYPFFFQTRDEYEEMGTLKILKINQEDTSIETKESHEFYELSDDYCSLGSIKYYQKMREHFKEEYNGILNRLMDCSVNKDIKSSFENNVGFKNSLLRTPEFIKSLNEAEDILKGHSRRFNSIFSYNCKIDDFSNKHKIHFDFEPIDKNEIIYGKSQLPHRIFCLIGENGVGKTQFLGKLALGLTGYEEIELKNNFSPGVPLFRKIIAISFSSFDSFKRPALKRVKKMFNYEYYGLKDELNNLLTDDKIQNQLFESILEINSSGKKDQWLNLLSFLFSREHLSNLMEKIKEKKNEINGKNNNLNIYNYLNVSSGQGIILNCITNLLANIEEETLVLFDEPEMHLHPKGISQLIDVLYRLLDENNSYAILATHSPIIIQQIPSKYVQIISRIDNSVSIVKPTLETFGENLSNLTNEVFKNHDETEYYKKVLKKIKYEDEILEEKLFEGKLSLNSKIYFKGVRR